MERMRRLRVSPAMRSMVRENHLRVDELICPIFVMEGENLCRPVDSMPGICQYSIDRLPEELDRIVEAGILSVLLFGIPAHKDEVGSGAYERAFRRIDPSLEVYSLACPLFVPLVEEGRCRPGDVVIETVAEEYLAPLRERGIDTLVLGCTHYPLLADVIRNIMGPGVTLVDAGAESARACQELLTQRGALANRPEGAASYYTSDRAENFQRLAALFLGEEGPVEVRQTDITQY